MTQVTNEYTKGELEALEAIGLDKEASLWSLGAKALSHMGGGLAKTIGKATTGTGRFLGNTLGAAKAGSKLVTSGKELSTAGKNLITKGRKFHLNSVIKSKNIMREAEGLRPINANRVERMGNTIRGKVNTKPRGNEIWEDMRKRNLRNAELRRSELLRKRGDLPGRKTGLTRNQRIAMKANSIGAAPNQITAGQYPGVMVGKTNTMPNTQYAVGAHSPYTPPKVPTQPRVMHGPQLPTAQEKTFEWIKKNPALAGAGALGAYGMYRQPSNAGGATIVNN